MIETRLFEQIDLSINNFEGTLPNNLIIGQELNLGQNQLTGTIPKTWNIIEVGRKTRRGIFLSGNKLEGDLTSDMMNNWEISLLDVK